MSDERRHDLEVRLLGTFRVTADDRTVDLPTRERRLVATLALSSTPLPRTLLARRLWPDAGPARAAGNLRTVVFAHTRRSESLLTVTSATLGLRARVDYHAALALIARTIDGETAPRCGELLTLLDRELLPDWSEDWLQPDQLRFRRLRVAALEAASAQFRERGLGCWAEQTADAAVRADPLRESAHRSLMDALVASGNPGEAIRAFHSYRRLTRTELGLDPSPAMQALFLRALEGAEASA